MSVITADLPATDDMALGLGQGRKLAIFLVMALGQFMALLDTQIVAASIGSIQAGLSAAPDEIDWLQTAYLMAEIVMIPLSAYLAQALSTRWMFVLSAGLFTVSSLMCGLSWDLPSMIVFRAVQGFVGGAMIPMCFSTGFTFFRGRQAAMATATLGVISTLAPTLGPTIGGWITDSFSWRWLFLINVPPGLLVTVALIFLGRIDRARPSMLLRIDWLHVASLAVSLAGLQFILEEGPRHQWFDDPAVTAVAWAAFIAALVFIERCLFSKMPVVRLASFRRPGFKAAAVLSFAVGFGLYGVVYLTPVFLARVRGFNSLEIGTTVFVAGAFMTAIAPVAAWLAGRVDQRVVMAVGLAFYATSFWMMSGVTSQWGFWQLFWPQVVRAWAVLLCMVSVVGMALNEAPPEELQDASGLTNLMRNLGGAVGIALVNTGLIDFFRLHLERLSEGLGHSSPDGAATAIQGLTLRFAASGLDPRQAGGMALGVLGQGVALQALTLAFSDVFRLMSWLFVACIVLVIFCRKGTMTSTAAAH